MLKAALALTKEEPTLPFSPKLKKTGTIMRVIRLLVGSGNPNVHLFEHLLRDPLKGRKWINQLEIKVDQFFELVFPDL